jgi:hypothetical protein
MALPIPDEYIAEGVRIARFESIVRIEEALIGHVEFDYHCLVEDRQLDLRPALGFDKRVIQEVCTTPRLPSKGHVSRLGA